MNGIILDSWKIAEILMGALLGVLLWIFGRLQTKVDNSVSKVEFKEALTELRSERDMQHTESRDERLRLHRENLDQFRDLASKLDTQAVQDQRILQCERDLLSLTKYTEDVKHLSVDPYVRATDVLKSKVDALESRRP